MGPAPQIFLASLIEMAETLVDATGYAVSCSKREAVEWFDKGMIAFVTLNGNFMSFFNKALEVDPEFVLVHCVLVSICVWGEY